MTKRANQREKSMSNPFPLSKDKLLGAYRAMKTIREFEE